MYIKIEQNHAQEDQLSLLMMFDFSRLSSPPPTCVPCSTAQLESASPTPPTPSNPRAQTRASALAWPCCLLAWPKLLPACFAKVIANRLGCLLAAACLLGLAACLLLPACLALLTSIPPTIRRPSRLPSRRPSVWCAPTPQRAGQNCICSRLCGALAVVGEQDSTRLERSMIYGCHDR